MRIFNVKQVLYALLFVGISSCTHDVVIPENLTSDTPYNTGYCNSDTMYYNKDIEPLILSNCATSGCHDAATAEHGVNLSKYSSVLSTGGIVPFNASNSEFIEVLHDNGDDRMPPLPAAKLPSDVIAKLELWINQGALNLTCTDTSICDTVNISYSTHIEPILALNCVGCHSGSSPEGGIDFTTYVNVKEQVDNRRIIGAVEGQNGFVAMPPNGNSLNNCNISQLNLWVNIGAPNN